MRILSKKWEFIVKKDGGLGDDLMGKVLFFLGGGVLVFSSELICTIVLYDVVAQGCTSCLKHPSCGTEFFVL
jgi:hypothetical protein